MVFVAPIMQKEIRINERIYRVSRGRAFILRLFILNWFLARPITVKYCDEYELAADESYVARN